MISLALAARPCGHQPIPRSFALVAMLMLAPPTPAQSLKFEAPSDAAALDAKVPALAEAALAQYRETDERQYLDTVLRLQTAAGRWAEAENTLGELRAKLSAAGDPQGRATDVQYQILLSARLIQSKEGISFEAVVARRQLRRNPDR